MILACTKYAQKFHCTEEFSHVPPPPTSAFNTPSKEEPRSKVTGLFECSEHVRPTGNMFRPCLMHGLSA